MNKNAKGLSTIVSTLIIILLVIVAIGIVWTVVSNLLDRNVNQIDNSVKCFGVDINVKSVVYNRTVGGTNYNVTLTRTTGGDDSEFYANLRFTNDTDVSDPIEFSETLGPLGTQTQNNVDGEVVNATKLEVIPFFKDESGTESLCGVTAEYNF